MHRPRIILSSLAVVVSAVGAIGCSSTSSTTPLIDNNTPVSFSKDVMPIFQQSCTVSSVCHGQMNNSAEENLYLGDNANNTPATLSQVYMGLVGVKSLEDPSMDLVAASDTANSFLSHKMKGDQNMFATQCGMAVTPCRPTCKPDTPCGTSMPYLNSVLPDSTNKIDNWIAQGAKNN